VEQNFNIAQSTNLFISDSLGDIIRMKKKSTDLDYIEEKSVLNMWKSRTCVVVLFEGSVLISCKVSQWDLKHFTKFLTKRRIGFAYTGGD